MGTNLTKIIEQALPLVSFQMGIDCDKYWLEQTLRMTNATHQASFGNIMPCIMENWSVDEPLTLIECLEHDQFTRAIPCQSLQSLEERILSGSSFLNPFVSFVIPIINGVVTDFVVLDTNGDKLVKHKHDESCRALTTNKYHLIWTGHSA